MDQYVFSSAEYFPTVAFSSIAPEAKLDDLDVDELDFGPPLAPGTRVRIVGEPIAMIFRSHDGEILRPDDLEGYYVVRLDEPATFHHADGTTEELREIIEAIFNLEPVASAFATPVLTSAGQ